MVPSLQIIVQGRSCQHYTNVSFEMNEKYVLESLQLSPIHALIIEQLREELSGSC